MLGYVLVMFYIKDIVRTMKYYSVTIISDKIMELDCNLCLDSDCVYLDIYILSKRNMDSFECVCYTNACVCFKTVSLLLECNFHIFRILFLLTHSLLTDKMLHLNTTYR